MTKRPPRRGGTIAIDDGVGWDNARAEPLLTDTQDLRPFNPLDTKNLAIAVGKAALEQNARPLGKLPIFRGAGIYLIYYSGDFQTYSPMAAANQDPLQPLWPIYIGKAIPEGGRKGRFTVQTTDTKTLRDRLTQHAKSIRAADNLDIEHFRCRFLIVHDLWIPLAEQLLIAHFAPVWNTLVDGFGNHDPGKGRHQGMISRWDVLHPGRPWASKFARRAETAADIEREVQHHLAGAAIPSLARLSSDLAD